MATRSPCEYLRTDSQCQCRMAVRNGSDPLGVVASAPDGGTDYQELCEGKDGLAKAEARRRLVARPQRARPGLRRRRPPSGRPPRPEQDRECRLGLAKGDAVTLSDHGNGARLLCELLINGRPVQQARAQSTIVAPGLPGPPRPPSAKAPHLLPRCRLRKLDSSSILATQRSHRSC
jgi:hypothetical protein